MAYRPCVHSTIQRQGKDHKGGTVWEQNDRYFRTKGEERNPLEMFDSDLPADLCEWKKNGEEIILMGDFSHHMYK